MTGSTRSRSCDCRAPQRLDVTPLMRSWEQPLPASNGSVGSAGGVGVDATGGVDAAMTEHGGGPDQWRAVVAEVGGQGMPQIVPALYLDARRAGDLMEPSVEHASIDHRSGCGGKCELGQGSCIGEGLSSDPVPVREQPHAQLGRDTDATATSSLGFLSAQAAPGLMPGGTGDRDEVTVRVDIDPALRDRLTNATARDGNGREQRCPSVGTGSGQQSRDIGLSQCRADGRGATLGQDRKSGRVASGR